MEGAVPKEGAVGGSTSELRAKLTKLTTLSRADKELIAVLQAQFAQQQDELHKRSEAIREIQDNVERISNVCRKQAQEAERLRADKRALQARLNESSAKGGEAARLAGELEAASKEADALRAELEAVRKSLTGALVEGESARAEARRAALRAEDSRRAAANAHEAREAAEREQELLRERAAAADAAAAAAEERAESAEGARAAAERAESSAREELGVLARSRPAIADLQQAVDRMCEENRALSELRDRCRCGTALPAAEARAAAAEARADEAEALLGAERTALPAAEARAAAAEARADEAEALLGEERGRCAAAAEALAALKASSAETREDLSKVLLEQRRENAGLRRDVSRLEALDGLGAELEAERARRGEAEQRIGALRDTEREVYSAVSKLLGAQEAMEGSFTCVLCMGMFQDPVACVPCGHTYCRACARPGHECAECGGSVARTVPVRVLDDLSGKFVFARQTLSRLSQVSAPLK